MKTIYDLEGIRLSSILALHEADIRTFDDIRGATDAQLFAAGLGRGSIAKVRAQVTAKPVDRLLAVAAVSKLLDLERRIEALEAWQW